jgi:mRNA interferase MazF
MKRGDVVLVRFPHPSGQRGKKRPAVMVQSDAYASAVSTVVVAEVTKNLTMKGDPACLFLDVSTPEGKATGLRIDSVVSSSVLDTVYSDTVAQVLGSLSPALLHKFRPPDIRWARNERRSAPKSRRRAFGAMVSLQNPEKYRSPIVTRFSRRNPCKSGLFWAMSGGLNLRRLHSGLLHHRRYDAASVQWSPSAKRGCC